MDETGRWLKRGPSRSVFLSYDEGDAYVVKRFRHPDRLRRLRDRARARNEQRILGRLHAAGVRVPRPLRLVEDDGAWEVHMEVVPDAVPLERMFLEDAAPGGGWEAFLKALGRELAGVQAARVRLRDLGAKNVLVDGDGAPWLIDFHDARLRRRDFTAREALADVVAAAAAGREALPPRLRLRFLAAWLAASGTRPRPDRVALEDEARSLRRSRVRRGLGRWLRESSRCRASSRGDRGELVVRRGRVDPDVASGSDELPLDEARILWLNAARLFEHGVPVCLPGELEWSDRGTRIVFDAPVRWSTEDGLHALLRDRGLALPSWEDALYVDDEGGVALRPPRELVDG